MLPCQHIRRPNFCCRADHFEAMKTPIKSLINLTLSSNKLCSHSNPSLPIKHLSILRRLSTTTGRSHQKTDVQVPNMSKKDSFILEKFRQRKLQGSLKTPTTTTTQTSQHDTDVVVTKSEVSKGEGTVVCGFQELGLEEEVAMAAGCGFGVWVPSETQCVSIPYILEGKSVILSSHFGSGRTLAYLLPLVQLLRRDGVLSRMQPKHPKAIVLCNTEELCDEGFRVAKSISDFARLKSASDNGPEHLSAMDVPDAPIGMLIGTPLEVVQQIEEGNIATDNVKYLVLDDGDAMFEHGFGPEISKITSQLENRKSESNNRELQAVLVTEAITKVLGKSGVMERLEHKNDGKVAAVLLEIDRMEVFEIIKSSDSLKKKMSEAINCISGS